MTVTWAVVILIVAVLIWLAITAIWLLGRVKQLQRRIEGLKDAPMMTAIAESTSDLERLNHALAELQAQLAALKAAQEKLTASLSDVRGLSLSSDVNFVERAYRGLVEVLR
ncbi:MAG: hypothetical protein JO024_03520 [Candidatus Eremiobacteraeota bacterium]|nr:hypothetical protein [Candidatus Eremiobacteraeota bacterium]